MAEPLSLLPVKRADVVLGKPLSQTIYDWHGNVLLAAGAVIQSQAQLEDIVDRGFIQDNAWDLTLKVPSTKPSGATKPADAGKPASTAAAPSPVPARPKPKLADPEEGKSSAGSKEIVMAMDEVHWHIGESMQMQPHDNPGARYNVQLIGFLKNRTVHVTAPVAEGKFVLIREGQTFVLRAFSGKNAYAFTAAALKLMHSPHPYLLLTYPKEVRCTVVRKNARVQVKLRASIGIGKPERVTEATLLDLSMGGTSAILKEPLGIKGETGVIRFTLHAADIETNLNLKVILRALMKGESGEGFRHGFEFVELSDQDRLALSAFVHQTLAEID